MPIKSGLQLTSVRLDKDTYYFLPSDFALEHGRDEAALRKFIKINIFDYKDGAYLPQTIGFWNILNFAKQYLQGDQEKLSKLYFHNLNHTFHPVRGVIAVALKMAIIDGTPPDQDNYECIGLAAALHDIGNIVQRMRHEKISVDTAKGKLRELEYDSKLIDCIENCIYSTAIEYNDDVPSRVVGSRDAKLLSDADLSNPGFFDSRYFAMESIKLWLELGNFDLEAYATEGVKFTRQFFEDVGDYHTSVGRFLFGEQRRNNMQNLEAATLAILQEADYSIEQLKRIIEQEDERLLNI